MGLINKNKSAGQECMYLILTGTLERNVPVASGLLKRPHILDTSIRMTFSFILVLIYIA